MLIWSFIYYNSATLNKIVIGQESYSFSCWMLVLKKEKKESRTTRKILSILSIYILNEISLINIMVKEMRWDINHWPILLKGHSKYIYNLLKTKIPPTVFYWKIVCLEFSSLQWGYRLSIISAFLVTEVNLET